ncbi:hypothetical protein GGI24_001071 [Coemansia furcata]|nr:hypothetical protein GGI24_001071 [Coemansia furcata]
MATSIPFDMSPEQRVSKVFQLLQDAGKKEYMGGEISLLDHALKAAQLAKNEDADEETILAALLTNIGRLFPPIEQGSAIDDEKFKYRLTGSTGISPPINYYRLGADYLRQLEFSEKTCDLIESQDLAIRTTPVHIPTYLMPDHDLMQINSTGRPSLTPNELEQFQNAPYFDETIQVMLWGCAATTSEIKPASLDSYRELAIDNINLEH